MKATILVGDVRARLADLADESMQCVVTSPPYWGLRDYGIQPSVWDGEPGCEHRFEFGSPTSETNYTDKRRWQHTRNGRDEEQPAEKRVGWARETVEHGQFCRCGAWLGCLGLEPTPELFIQHTVQVFREARRVLRKDGTLWLNIGDSYAQGGNGGHQTGDSFHGHNKREGDRTRVPKKAPEGLKPKDLVGIPWMLAFALRADGWWLRQDIIWNKPNPMPESVLDRCTKAHEYLFLLTKSATYHCDMEAIKEDAAGWNGSKFEDGKNLLVHPNVGKNRPGGKKPDQFDELISGVGEVSPSRNKRSVWTIATQPFSGARLMRGAFGDSDHTASPDCPLHGDRPIEASTDRYDELPTASQSGRSLGTDAHHVQELPGVPGPTQTLPGEDSSLDNSDSQDRPYSQPATARSTQSHRTDHVPATSQHETHDAASPLRTDDSKPQLSQAAISDHIPESRNEEGSCEDEMEINPWEQIQQSSVHKCTCKKNNIITDHFAVFPEALVEPCILAGSKPGDTVLDPFCGSGTTGAVALRYHREFIGIELNPEYAQLAERRIGAEAPMFNQVEINSPAAPQDPEQLRSSLPLPLVPASSEPLLPAAALPSEN